MPTHFETFAEKPETRTFVPPFGLIGISPNVILSQASPDEYKPKQDAFLKQGDKIVAFIDSLGGVSRHTIDDRADVTLPPDATVADHLAAAEPKFKNFLIGKNVMELVDANTYIGPYVVCVVDGITRSLVNCVRLAIYLRNQPEDR